MRPDRGFILLDALRAPQDEAMDQVNLVSTIPAPRRRQLRFGQCAPTKLTPLLGDIVVDALVFEFMGLAMLGLCVVVLAVPSGRQSSGRIRNP
jgi:hypothetical protein